MRFLCLHGRGTNGQILEAQTAAIRIELGDGHTYEFVDGVVRVPLDPQLMGTFPENDEYYNYYDDTISSKIACMADLDDMIQHDGPFDGILAFSHGAVLASSYLIREAKLNPTKHLLDPTFKLAIFFSAVQAVDPIALLEQQEQKTVGSADGVLIKVPTAHIWGKNDTMWAKESKEVAAICEPGKRAVYVHKGGHEVPGARDKTDLYGAVHAVRRTIDAAMAAQSA